MIQKMLLIQQMKRADRQSDDQHNRKLGEGQTTYDIVNLWFFSQLFFRSFRQAHKKPALNPKDLVLLLALDYACRRIKA